MKIPVYAYIVVGADGEESSAVCGDRSDCICLGAYDSQGRHQHFESEAYHVPAWAKEHGFQIRHSVTSVEL